MDIQLLIANATPQQLAQILDIAAAPTVIKRDYSNLTSSETFKPDTGKDFVVRKKRRIHRS